MDSKQYEVTRTDEEWRRSQAQCLGMLLSGEGLEEYGERGDSIKDSNFLLLMNAHHEDIAFTLPNVAVGAKWRALVDTTWTDQTRRSVHESDSTYPLQARSLALLVEHRGFDRRGEA